VKCPPGKVVAWSTAFYVPQEINSWQVTHHGNGCMGLENSNRRRNFTQFWKYRHTSSVMVKEISTTFAELKLVGVFDW
jgi:hypothetical protein